MAGPGRVVALYVAAAGGQPVRAVARADAVVGGGLLGDRYQRGTGHWSYQERLRDDVTLVAAEALAAAAAEHGVALGGGASRRNAVTEGVDLDALVGREFAVGGALLRGERPCEPCRYLDGLVGGPARAALAGRGGLRATVVRAGRLAVGDAVLPGPPGPPDTAS
ncbi:MOSC domain-containing protein [Quadrisphaera sp. DSM 44207]|uniref:MOSC domain-containing protein n=1 Tax=Quadrisphaera sp. DSM 44207 TaxID=1881057 RepID=UPI00087FA43E|nr:MOSC domain-containing protein [Quadrisphaera sp. DSM 44207]SDQ48301.1 MOSC domain-containing protein [Quadrisphaera sp. DSM 44207]